MAIAEFLYTCNAVTTTEPMLTYFTEAVCEYGLPSRDRADRGVENVGWHNTC